MTTSSIQITSSEDHNIGTLNTTQKLNEIITDCNSTQLKLDYQMVASIYLNVLVTANLLLTFCFYLSWRKRQTKRGKTNVMDRKPGTSVRAKDPQREKDDVVYSDIRESYFSGSQIRTYAAINSKPSKRDKNTYKGLASFRRGNRERWKTLTALFRSQSHEVDQTVSNLSKVTSPQFGEDCQL